MKVTDQRMPSTNHEKDPGEHMSETQRVFQTNLSCLTPDKSSHPSCTWSQVMRVEKDMVRKRAG